MPAASNLDATYQRFFTEEIMRGEELCYRARWFFVGLISLIILAMLLYAPYRSAVPGAVVALVLMSAYNHLLGIYLKRGQVPTWLRYLTAALDILLITMYNVVTSYYISPVALVTAPTILLYPVILLFIALRLDKWYLLFSLALTLLLYNLAYFLRLPDMDPQLLESILFSDLPGQIFKSAFLLTFGLALFFIHQTVHRLVSKQAAMYREAQKAEEAHLANLETQVQQRTEELTQANQDLRQALSEVKTLSGLLPICSHCKKIRDDQGYWQVVEEYISAHSQADFSHGICPDCLGKHYPEVYDSLAGRLPQLIKKGEE